MTKVQHLKIYKALVVDRDNEGVEKLFALRCRSLYNAVKEDSGVELMPYCCLMNASLIS